MNHARKKKPEEAAQHSKHCRGVWPAEFFWQPWKFTRGLKTWKKVKSLFRFILLLFALYFQDKLKKNKQTPSTMFSTDWRCTGAKSIKSNNSLGWKSGIQQFPPWLVTRPEQCSSLRLIRYPAAAAWYVASAAWPPVSAAYFCKRKYKLPSEWDVWRHLSRF